MTARSGALDNRDNFDRLLEDHGFGKTQQEEIMKYIARQGLSSLQFILPCVAKSVVLIFGGISNGEKQRIMEENQTRNSIRQRRPPLSALSTWLMRSKQTQTQK